MDIASVEKKWRERWNKEKAYEADVDGKRKKKYITAAFPYPNSPQHIGHGRTYTTTDIYARYLRLKGYNVLFPMAFHVTGTPIIAMAQRIAERDPDVLKVFTEIYGIPEKKALSLTDPTELVTYFSKEIEEGMREMGYSIDWRRKFYSFDPKFNAFIQWQFRKLKELGYLIKGEYPIAWCPNDRQAVSAHDTRGDVDPELEQVTVIKFAAEDGSGYFIVTTYRPETVYGVTNIWVNPQVEYVKAKLNGEHVYIAKKAAELLGYQLEIDVVEDVPAEKLLKMRAKNPATGSLAPLYPASFVSEEVGTGVVMSVPAHAPYDYLALRDLGRESIEMPQVIGLPGYGKVPAKEEVERMGVKNQNDPLAEKATNEIYKKEAHEGKMVIGKYKGMPVMQAKEKVGGDLIAEKKAFSIYSLANAPVNCRCGEEVVVNILKDQWFIDYGKPDWKEKAKECLNSMSTIPEETRSILLYTVDWLKTRPCTRAKGLGTKFPFDESKVIEALADSTIYMAYYTISNILSGVDEKEMTEEFFDYVLLGKGKGSAKMKKLRDSFLYWYPLDSRHSGADLLRNHLTLFVFNHAAIFPKAQWPRQIATNGFVLMDGTKMSKSMGNILPLRKAIAEYGADVIRFSVVSGAELLKDTDFNRTVAEGVKSRIILMEELLEESLKEKGKADTLADRWLLSRLNRKLKNADSLYSSINLRGLSMELFYDLIADLRWYMKRTKKRSLRHFFEKWTVAVSPFMPHIANEFWEMLGHKELIDFEKFPAADEKAISDEIEQAEDFIRQARDDLEKLVSLVQGKTGKKAGIITLYIAGDWKRKVYEIFRKEKALDKTMKAVQQDAKLKAHAKDVPAMLKPLMRNVHALPEMAMSEKEELEILEDAKDFFEAEFSCKIEILSDAEAKHEKARNAMPGKPAIVIE
ncbi:leucine--tRNA ligase [Candidatus Micrarchaeota archaeon]|nr:leucine--tRNA ligase [Candidatus Micrarchaeota archaeon]